MFATVVIPAKELVRQTPKEILIPLVGLVPRSHAMITAPQRGANPIHAQVAMEVREKLYALVAIKLEALAATLMSLDFAVRNAK
jgi:hypothetical protein